MTEDQEHTDVLPLDRLVAQAHEDREMLGFPARRWVPSRVTTGGEPLLKAPPADEANPRQSQFSVPDIRLCTRHVTRRQQSISRIFMLQLAATLNTGPSGAAVGPLKHAVPRLVRALTADLFRQDIEHHWRDFQAFREGEYAEYLLDSHLRKCSST